MKAPLDIHTHTPGKINSVFNSSPDEALPVATLFSCGIHPCRIPKEWRSLLVEIEHRALHPMCWAIGECGLDSLSPFTLELQTEVFEAQCRIAERMQKPLIVHCVRRIDDVLRICRPLTTQVIIHGFRGKPQQARSLLDAGFYLSFGERFNAESYALCPPSRRLFETDESLLTIEQIIARFPK